jgi:hypothetical protein
MAVLTDNRIKILIADDNLVIQKVIRTCLAPDQSFPNLPQNVFRPKKLNNMMLILDH